MQELQKQSNEISILPTGKNQVIKSLQQPKIFSCSDDEIKSTFKYIFALVGLREYPTDIRKKVLFDFIKTNYANYALDEIKTAFQLALKNEFICEIKHYEMFSPSYFSGVFEAYIEYRSGIAREFMAKEQNKLDEPKKKTAEEVLELKKQFFTEILKPIFDNFQETKKLDFDLTPVRIIYESLKNDHQAINLSNEEKDEIKKQAQLLTYLPDDKINKLIRTKKTSEEKFKDFCQEIAIKISFEKLINKKEILISKL